MRRVHLIIGLLGVIAFLLTGQVMKYHHPRMAALSAEMRMSDRMAVSGFTRPAV